MAEIGIEAAIARHRGEATDAQDAAGERRRARVASLASMKAKA
jgi:hypothetical protein